MKGLLPFSERDVSISIVSHRQGPLIAQLLADLVTAGHGDAELIVTLNLPEDERFLAVQGLSPIVIRNAKPEGFGANHNAAFERSTRPFFAVVNPDIRCRQLGMSTLLEPLHDPQVALVAPRVLNSQGGLEDSFRRDPTLVALAKRVMTGKRVPGYTLGDKALAVDWVAGMYMVVRREEFEAVGGFDARRFFMYFEDADLCRRLRQRGRRVVVQPAASVIHDAQRDSHRNWRHLRWHLTSAVRYLLGI